jgi:hypothetical protein
MGSVWSFDAIFCWIYNTGEQSPWYITVIDCAMFLQAIAIFIIFCCNRRTMKQLEDKFPFFKSKIFQEYFSELIKKARILLVAFVPLKRILKIPETSMDCTDTTPGTPGSRKMSTISMTSSKMGTLERRQI